MLTGGNEELKGCLEVSNDWEGQGVKYAGNADFMIGTYHRYSLDSHVLVMQARGEWSDRAIPLILAEAGCLLKRRLEAEKKTPVFAVLSNGSLFRFFAIDTDSAVYSSAEFPLTPGQDGSFQSSTSLPEILRWLRWILSSYESRAFTERLSDDSIVEALVEIRRCFIDVEAEARRRLN